MSKLSAIKSIFLYTESMTGQVNPLAGLLAQYQGKIDKIDQDRTAIVNAVKEATGVTITTKEYEIRNHVLYLKIHPAKRQIVFFRKNELLAALQALPQKIIVDVR